MPHKPFTSRADLHVHSRHSDRPSEWILRRIGAPECFVEPLDIYQRARARGMDFVTISDHNKIAGALEIAHLPGTFISVEVTTYFPENGAKMHILACGIDEAQFAQIQELRENIYELRDYFVCEDIIHSVAHPLFLVNHHLTIDQFERLLLLFNRFEAINGTRDPRASKVVRAVLDSLTVHDIERLANKHGIVPIGPQPHRKLLTGGSDDHSGAYIASAHTITPEAFTVPEYLDHLRAGRHEPGGESGSSIHLAHCFYHIAYCFYKQRLAAGGTILGEMFSRLLDPPRAAVQPTGNRVIGKVKSWWIRRKLSDPEALIAQEFTELFQSHTRPDRSLTATEAFVISCRLSHQLSYAFAQRFIDKLATGNLIKSLEAMAAMGPVLMSIAPYLAAFATQNKDEQFVQQVARHFPAAEHLEFRSDRRAWLTDTFDDINGVARTIRTLASLSHERENPLSVLTCLQDTPKVDFDLRNFQPVGMFDVPEYPQQRVAFPPFLQIIEHIEREQFHELIISTPGPMGLVGLAAARMLKLRTVGIYHTDFPQYVRCLTDDPAIEALAWRYMYWFYEQCDTVFVPSEYYRRNLVEHGFSPHAIKVLRRGVAACFSPAHARDGFWTERGGRDTLTFLYVGRMSEEKNIHLLIHAFCELRKTMDCQLALVGDGPRLPQCRGIDDVIVTGVLRGDELSAAYASSDIFVFPSTSDTFGNVVLEAHASGLPAIVSDSGGPQEIVGQRHSGLIVDLSDPIHARQRLATAMEALATDCELRSLMADLALETARGMSWQAVLATLLQANEKPKATTPVLLPAGIVG
jgi:glycosyltransferase involved in cell wall biosynthesis